MRLSGGRIGRCCGPGDAGVDTAAESGTAPPTPVQGAGTGSRGRLLGSPGPPLTGGGDPEEAPLPRDSGQLHEEVK